MGEYATHKSQRIKIGTCEDMYYLRFDQRTLVRGEGTDPVRDAQEIRFRFPWPDEDHIEPGAFGDPFRSLGLHGVEIPEAVTHGSVQFCAKGYNVLLPCPESAEGRKLPVHRNGFGSSVHIIQQRLVGSKLVTIAKCGGCDSAYRLPDLNSALPVINKLEEMADRERDDHRANWYREVSRRILKGYESEQEFKRLMESL